MRARATLLATSAAILTLAGCKDSGLPDRNLPFEEAEHRAPDALVQAVHPDTRPGADAADPHGAMSMATRPITVGEQTFVAAGTPITMDAAGLSQVGSVGGMSFMAAPGDDAPYDRLYMAHGDQGFVVYEPVHDATGDPNARAAASAAGMESGGGAAH